MVLWIADNLQAQVDVEVGPVEVTRSGLLDIQDMANRSLAKPREVGERQKILAVWILQPQLVLGCSVAKGSSGVDL